MTAKSLLQTIEDDSKAAGLSITNLESSVDKDSVGDGWIVGQLGPLRVRFVRDRGQDWLEIGPLDATPSRFYSFQDVQIALGWKSIAEVLDMQDVEPLGDVLQCVASQWSEINRALAAGSSSRGWKRVEKAANARGEAFESRLR